MTEPLRFSWVDVFTDRPFAGNPLAVVPDADALDTSRMQTIAAELRLSETVFVTADARAIRIFTPQAELPLAGHPIVGTSLELARLGRITNDGTHTFETGAGPLDVEVRNGVATMNQLDLERGASLDAESVARALGVSAEEIVGTPAICSTTNNPQAFAQLRARDTLRGLRPDLDAIGQLDAIGLSAWVDEGNALAQRFFAPAIGIAEDPATGSAAGALVALRVANGAAPGPVIVQQGDEIGRPSRIQVSVGGEPWAPAGVRVGGRAALVLEGQIVAS